VPSERSKIFNAGCSACDDSDDSVAMIRRIACTSCEFELLDVRDPVVAARAKSYGIRTVPAVAVDGRLAACCEGSGPDEASLRAAGIGVSLP
jgi:glutaredoxin 3